MVELELTRTPGDRRLFVLGDVGTVRVHGWSGARATAEAGGRRWELARRGFWRPAIVATDPTGGTAGRFVAPGWRRGGSLWWGDRELLLRPASAWRERYALADGDRELATLEGKGWGARPVAVTVHDREALDPGLLLLAAFVVRGLAEDAGGAAAAAAT